MIDVHGYLVKTVEGNILVVPEGLDYERYDNIAIASDYIGEVEVSDEVMAELNEEFDGHSEDISPDPDYPIVIGEIEDIDDIDDSRFSEVVSDIYGVLNDISEDREWEDNMEDEDDDYWGDDD